MFREVLLRRPTHSVATPGQVARGVAPVVVVCDPTRLYADATAAIIGQRTAWQVVATEYSLVAAQRALSACGAQVLLFDTPDVAPVHVAQKVRQLRAQFPAVALVLLTQHTDGEFLRRALEAGLDACLHKREGVDVLDAALGSLRGGASFISPLVHAYLAGSTPKCPMSH